MVQPVNSLSLSALTISKRRLSVFFFVPPLLYKIALILYDSVTPYHTKLAFCKRQKAPQRWEFFVAVKAAGKPNVEGEDRHGKSQTNRGEDSRRGSKRHGDSVRRNALTAAAFAGFTLRFSKCSRCRSILLLFQLQLYFRSVCISLFALLLPLRLRLSLHQAALFRIDVRNL